MTDRSVQFKREEYVSALEYWELVDDAAAGSIQVKSKAKTYLLAPDQEQDDARNDERYKFYKFRAVYYNVIGRTLQSLVGAAFRKDPVLEAPESIDYITDDIDGGGLSIYQQSQEVMRDVLKRGRHFVFVDYPQRERTATRAEMALGNIRANVVSVGAKRVINWRTTKVGSVHKLSMVVIKEVEEEELDFAIEKIDQYRVLRLTDGVYTQEVWRANDDGDWYLYIEPFAVLDGSGKPWDEIPGMFVGANNNDTHIDPSPLYDLSDLNLAHYRNSADYEDGTFVHGQGTMVVNIGEMNAKDFLDANPGGLKLGARGGFIVGNGGSAELLQMDANSAAKEAMDHKEAQMLGLGARLITPGSAVKTATEAQGEQEAEHSVLSLVVANVNEAYNKCLGWMLRFMNASGEVKYEINQDFTRPHLDAQTLAALVQLWMTGKYPEGDLWAQLRKYGLIDEGKDNEAIKDELESQGGGLGLDE